MAVAAEQQQQPEVPERRERVLLRPWLENLINSGLVPGLEWIDTDKTTFKVPWKHRSKKNWSLRHSSVFLEWAKNTGRWSEGDPEPNYAQLKTRLRCAFSKAPDIEELKALHCTKSEEPYKVYRFTARRAPRSSLFGRRYMSRTTVPITVRRRPYHFARPRLPLAKYHMSMMPSPESPIEKMMKLDLSSPNAAQSGIKLEVADIGDEAFFQDTRRILPRLDLSPDDVSMARQLMMSAAGTSTASTGGTPYYGMARSSAAENRLIREGWTRRDTVLDSLKKEELRKNLLVLQAASVIVEANERRSLQAASESHPSDSARDYSGRFSRTSSYADGDSQHLLPKINYSQPDETSYYKAQEYAAVPSTANMYSRQLPRMPQEQVSPHAAGYVREAANVPSAQHSPPGLGRRELPYIPHDQYSPPGPGRQTIPSWKQHSPPQRHLPPPDTFYREPAPFAKVLSGERLIDEKLKPREEDRHINGDQYPVKSVETDRVDIEARLRQLKNLYAESQLSPDMAVDAAVRQLHSELSENWVQRKRIKVDPEGKAIFTKQDHFGVNGSEQCDYDRCKTEVMPFGQSLRVHACETITIDDAGHQPSKPRLLSDRVKVKVSDSDDDSVVDLSCRTDADGEKQCDGVIDLSRKPTDVKRSLIGHPDQNVSPCIYYPRPEADKLKPSPLEHQPLSPDNVNGQQPCDFSWQGIELLRNDYEHKKRLIMAKSSLLEEKERELRSLERWLTERGNMLSWHEQQLRNSGNHMERVVKSVPEHNAAVPMTKAAPYWGAAGGESRVPAGIPPMFDKAGQHAQAFYQARGFPPPAQVPNGLKDAIRNYRMPGVPPSVVVNHMSPQDLVQIAPQLLAQNRGKMPPFPAFAPHFARPELAAAGPRGPHIPGMPDTVHPLAAEVVQQLSPDISAQMVAPDGSFVKKRGRPKGSKNRIKFPPAHNNIHFHPDWRNMLRENQLPFPLMNHMMGTLPPGVFQMHPGKVNMQPRLLFPGMPAAVDRHLSGGHIVDRSLLEMNARAEHSEGGKINSLKNDSIEAMRNLAEGHLAKVNLSGGYIGGRYIPSAEEAEARLVGMPEKVQQLIVSATRTSAGSILPPLSPPDDVETHRHLAVVDLCASEDESETMTPDSDSVKMPGCSVESRSNAMEIGESMSAAVNNVSAELVEENDNDTAESCLKGESLTDAESNDLSCSVPEEKAPFPHSATELSVAATPSNEQECTVTDECDDCDEDDENRLVIALPAEADENC